MKVVSQSQLSQELAKLEIMQGVLNLTNSDVWLFWHNKEGTLIKNHFTTINTNTEDVLRSITEFSTDNGISIIDEDPVIAQAKLFALDTIFSDHPYNPIAYDFAMECALNNFRHLDGFIVCEKFAEDDIDEIKDALDTEHKHLMRFSKFVVSQQPNVFLLITDFDGGQENSWVVRGTYEDAKKSMVYALKDIDPNINITDSNFDDVMEAVGDDSNPFWVKNDATYVFHASIEEV